MAMRILEAGQFGETSSEDVSWESLQLNSVWLPIINKIAPGSKPHDIQIKALRDCQMLESRRNMIVSGPTNSGKSLLGYLAIFAGLKKGRRALLVEPFRALAQEKFDELSALLPKLASKLDDPPGIEISTGDYRLNGESMMADPPQTGEIVIATPERIDAIMRNPDFDDWISSFGVICIDEAHLISDQKRGPTLEGVITRFLCEKAPPRLVLLSATIGGCQTLKEWLQPCDVAYSAKRHPVLQQQIAVLEDGEVADEAVISLLQRALIDIENSVLIFVYRTNDAENLAAKITKAISKNIEGEGVPAEFYHSKMPAENKTRVKNSYLSGEVRCLVSTTALGAGVNFPATHVIIRDLTFGRDGALPLTDMVQMMGRAGRGQREGKSCVILKPKDIWKETELLEGLKNPKLPELKSALLQNISDSRLSDENLKVLETAKLVLGRIVRRDHESFDELMEFFENSLGGNAIKDDLFMGFKWLLDPQRILAWSNEHGIGATTLGKAVAKTGLPLEVGTGFASLIRDIISCDPDDEIISRWKPLDTLIVLEMINPREKGLKRYSKKIPEQVDAWIEQNHSKPVLFTEWIRGSVGASKAEEILGSLCIEIEAKGDYSEATRKYAYLATMRAIIIYQLGHGALIKDVERRWGIKNLDGVSERWRDHLLWQITGIPELLEIPCFYYFLCNDCRADDERIKRIKKHFNNMSLGAFKLLGLLRFCSPLGPLFRDIEAAKAGVGIKTKEKLEAAGLTSFQKINKVPVETLYEIGIRRDIANKLKNYITRRLI